MLDFGLLPPEITSAQMYSGPGSEPTTVAASAWDALAAELDSFARGYSSVTSSLQDEAWAGPAAQAMAAAAAPFAQWAATTAARAEQAGSQARVAAAAFEAAHAATVPPPVVAANRIQLANLITTNVLGQNTAQIAVTEAAYDAMWVQDARAMQGYATLASSATKLATFTGPPPTTNPAAAPAAPAASQSVLAHVLSTVPQLLSTAPGAGTSPPAGIPIPQSLMTSMSNAGTLEGIADFYSELQVRNISTIGDFIYAGVKYFTDGALAAKAGLTGATSPATAGVASPTVLAAANAGATVNRAVLVSVGEATAVGQLSAPPTWANATPVATAADPFLSSWGTKGSWEAAPKMQVAGTGQAAAMAPMAGAAGAGAVGKVVRPSVSAILQVTPPRYQMPRPSSGG